ncbi:MAG TPA: tRNA (adenosine(37)-N6)-dimethylallyltransferase MiaA [Patescibacteria group bacterium]
MPNAKPKIIIILGPTASGKSDAAIKLAKKFNGEIISADSRQVFRKMDIGTGKVPGALQKGIFISDGIAHHLIDVADPGEELNISHFIEIVNKTIPDILKRGKLPIICGGTGFWIKAIVDNTALPEVKPDEKLRNLLRSKSAEELFVQLQKLDSERAEIIDKNNSVRLIRAIEIATALGKVPQTKSTDSKYEFLQIGLEVPRELLNAKIKKRLEARFNEGMIDEVKNLLSTGVSPEWLERIGLEYRWIARYLQNKIDLKEMQKKLYFDIIHYAKRQMTWFKKDQRIMWLKDYSEIETVVKNFLK